MQQSRPLITFCSHNIFPPKIIDNDGEEGRWRCQELSLRLEAIDGIEISLSLLLLAQI